MSVLYPLIIPCKEASIQSSIQTDATDALLFLTLEKVTPTSIKNQMRDSFKGDHKNIAVQTKVTCLNNNRKTLQNVTHRSAILPTESNKISLHQELEDVCSQNNKQSGYHSNKTLLLTYNE